MERIINMVMERANEMLKDPQINKQYQAFKTVDEAKDWILKCALATLILPVDERHPPVTP